LAIDGLAIGDWGLPIGANRCYRSANPQSPNPQSVNLQSEIANLQ